MPRHLEWIYNAWLFGLIIVPCFWSGYSAWSGQSAWSLGVVIVPDHFEWTQCLVIWSGCSAWSFGVDIVPGHLEWT